MHPEKPDRPAVLQCFNNIQTEAIRWLWPARIARGKLTLIVGPPGTGKSQLGVYLAAMTSRGRPLADGSECHPGNVIILSAEDDPADTIKPRLEAGDADMDRVFILDVVRDTNRQGEPVARRFNLQSDMRVLDAEIARLGDVALLIIDPISAYLGGVDSHSNAKVRGLLAYLSAMASRCGIAIVAVSHLNKGNGSAIDRVTGSGAFVAAARASYLVCKDRDDANARLFLPIKNNLGNDSTGLAFRIEAAELPSGVQTSRIVWEPGVVKVSADEALTAPTNPSARRAVDEAKTFLLEALSQGPQPAKDLRADANGMGLSWAAVRRAQHQLGIRPVKVGYQGVWMWFIPGLGPFELFEDVQMPQHGN